MKAFSIMPKQKESLDLFSENADETKPLAELLRPTDLSQLVGQKHLLGEGKPLSRAFKAGRPFSMLFWGPPGIGKTTIARMAARYLNCELISLSAVYCGLKEVRSAVDAATRNKSVGLNTILFIDELHRFNKAQQDALLPFVENGTIFLIGATTENPSFEINQALLSRTHLFILKKLEESDLLDLYTMAKKRNWLKNIDFEEQAIILLAKSACGDARRFINYIDQCIAMHMAETSENTSICIELVKSALTTQVRQFDDKSDYFYEQISALHKSIRGSHPNAAIFWLNSMLLAGADPLYLIRRLIRIAWEDIGLADPRAIELAVNCAKTYERLGSPEGDLAITQTAIYLACAPKSNAGYVAHNTVRDFLSSISNYDVPVHLRNAPTTLLSDLGYGKQYRYSHNEPNAYSAGQEYMPDNITEQSWYSPTEYGIEIKIKEKLEQLVKKDALYQTKNKQYKNKLNKKV